MVKLGVHMRANTRQFLITLLNKEFSNVNAGLEQSRYNIAAKSGSTGSTAGSMHRVKAPIASHGT